MAPAIAGSTRERARKMALLNALPLTGTHFLEPRPTRKAPVSSSSKSTIPQPGSQDSPLSEDELEAVYGHEASLASSPPGRRPPVMPYRPVLVSMASPAPRTATRTPRSPRRRKYSFTSKSAPLQAVAKTRKVRLETPAEQASKVATTRSAKRAKRRLPVNELMLVSSSPDKVFHDPPSSYAGVDEQDPISNSTQSEQHTLQLSEEDGTGHKAPLTSIRKRLKTPKFTHKSVIALRKKHEQRPQPFFKTARACRDLGDGFTPSERKSVQRRLVTNTKTPRPTRSLGVLAIGSGPLPEVTFYTSSFNEPSHVTPLLHEGDPSEHTHLVETPTTHAGRRVSFSDRDMIMARLSSVSAPRRAYSISSNESDDQIDEDDFLESDDTCADDLQPTHSKTEWCSTPPTANSENIGLRRTLGSHKLVEVNESIDSEDFVPLPRSILRNKFDTSESDHRPELTASNTRRNRTRANSEIDLEENPRYFASAAKVLGETSTKPRIIKHRSSDRHNSYHFANSAKQVQVPDSEAHIAESSTAVRETSLDPLDFTQRSQLSTLRRRPGVQWTSSIPNVSRDLRTLTRRVSRDHGTLSQSLKRRASQVLFHSPTKVR